MQHAKQKRTLGRPRSQRTALLRGLAISLIRDGKIVTTAAKAKELRPFVERLITTAKTDSVANRRRVSSQLGEEQDAIVSKLFTTVAPAHVERPGGYTRIIKMGRTAAGRDEALIEIV